MARILLVLTGGTIGSTASSGQLDADTETASTLLQQAQLYPSLSTIAIKQMDIKQIQPFSLLSENLAPETWLILYNALCSANASSYDGVIVTHGTDTLPYTAAALSYLCSALQVPVVLIASNYPLADARGKGVNNFYHALHFIKETRLPGVYIAFETAAGVANIHLGTRLLPSSPFTDEYGMPFGQPFGYMEEKRFVPVSGWMNPSIDQIRQRALIACKQPLEQPAFASGVALIRPYPGLDYTLLSECMNSSVPPCAILHELYHSGTGSTRHDSDGRFSLPAFAERCRQAGIPLYIGPIKNPEGQLYRTTREVLQAGALPLPYMTIEAAHVKLMLAYGTFSHGRNEWLKATNLFFEQLPLPETVSLADTLE